VKVVREASGNVRRLSAAVVINHRSSVDRAGKETSAPIPQAQIDQMTALVRETIGFNQERGDSVNLMNAPFNVTKLPESETLAWWQQHDNQELARSMAWPLAMVGLGVLVLLGLVRPGMKLLQAPPVTLIPINGQQPQLSAVLNEAPERPGLPMPGGSAVAVVLPEHLRLEDAKRLAKENPMAVANIVKGWVNGEVPV